MNKTPLKPGLYLIPLTTLIAELECVAVTLVEVPADLPFEVTASEANAFAARSYHHGQGTLDTLTIGRPTFESEPGFLVYPEDIEAMPVDASSLPDAVCNAMRSVTYSARDVGNCRAEIEEYLAAFDEDAEEDDGDDE
jgi:hypothetical protein